MRRLGKTWWVILGSATLGILTWGYLGVHEYRQIQNSVAVQNAHRCVKRAIASHQSLEACSGRDDAYGREIRLLHENGQYLIVSYGKDGVPDRKYHASISLKRLQVCKNWNLDTVWTKDGSVQACLK